jgi:O-antigen ligase
MYNPGLEQTGRVVSTPRTQLHARILDSLQESFTFANIVGLLGAILTILCLVGLPGSNFWNIRIPLYLLLSVCTILRPRTALYLLPIAIPWGSLDTVTFGKLNANSADILVILFIVSWLCGYALRSQGILRSGPLDQEESPLPRYLVVGAFALLFAMIVSTVTAFSVNTSIKELIKWIEFVAVLLLGAKYLRTRRQIWTLVVIMLLAGISQAFYGYAQDFFNLGPQSFIRNGGLRVYGTFNQPNPYAGYINMSLPIALSLMLLGRNWATRILTGTGTLILGVAEYLTLSNGGEIAISAAVALILIVGFPQLRKLAAIAGVAALGLIAALTAGIIPMRLTKPILNKLGLVAISFTAPSPQNYSTAERLAHWLAGIGMFLDHPFTGVGIGNYGIVYAHYHVGIFVNSLDHAHNYYINISAETGVIGLTAFIFLIVAIFVAGTHAYKVVNSSYRSMKMAYMKPKAGKSRLEVLLSSHALGNVLNDRALVIGLLASLLGVCVHNLVDNLYVHGMTILFALLIIALVRVAGIYTASEKGTIVHDRGCANSSLA